MVKLQVATGCRDTHWARGKDAHSLNFDFSWDADGVNTLQFHSVFVLQQVGAIHSHLNTHGKQHIAGHQFDSHWTVKRCRADSSLTPDWSARLSPWTGLGGWGWWARSRPRAWRASRSGSVRGPSTLSSACCTRWTTFWSSGWNGTLRRPAASRCCRRWSPPGTCETANRERRSHFKNLHPDSDVFFFFKYPIDDEDRHPHLSAPDGTEPLIRTISPGKNPPRIVPAKGIDCGQNTTNMRRVRWPQRTPRNTWEEGLDRCEWTRAQSSVSSWSD